MVIFHSFLYVYQRVVVFQFRDPCGLNPLSEITETSAVLRPNFLSAASGFVKQRLFFWGSGENTPMLTPWDPVWHVIPQLASYLTRKCLKKLQSFGPQIIYKVRFPDKKKNRTSTNLHSLVRKKMERFPDFHLTKSSLKTAATPRSSSRRRAALWAPWSPRTFREISGRKMNETCTSKIWSYLIYRLYIQ